MERKDNNSVISVVLATLNEEKGIGPTLEELQKVLDDPLLVVVDGKSVDKTVEIAKNMGADVIMQDGKGKGNAIRYGVKQATGDIVVMIDADISMDPEEIPGFIEPLLRGYDFVKGSRFLSNAGTMDMSAYRSFGNRVFLFLVNRLFGGKYTDLCYGYNAFWRDTFQTMGITSDGFEIETEINIKVLKAGLKVTEVPSYEEPRLNGVSNLRSFRDGMRILRTIFKLRFSKTHQFSNFLEVGKK